MLRREVEPRSPPWSDYFCWACVIFGCQGCAPHYSCCNMRERHECHEAGGRSPGGRSPEG